MADFEGWIREIRLDRRDQASAWVDCDEKVLPTPGQYLSAWAVDDRQASLGVSLFPAEIEAHGFLAAPPVPKSWEPGAHLILRGPLGNGFRLPSATRRLALAALGDTPARLMALIPLALARDVEVALFADGALPSLPAAVEVFPLNALSEELAWADLLALDLPRELLPRLAEILGVDPAYRQVPPIQALIYASMPCAGIGECGACAATLGVKWKLLCKDGPVLELNRYF